jgi:hypothetical protein
MKTKLLCLMIALCIILSFIPVSAEEAPAITIITQPAAETVVTKGEVSGKLYVSASASDGSELSYQWYETPGSNRLGEEIPGAMIRGISPDEVRRITFENATSLFKTEA